MGLVMRAAVAALAISFALLAGNALASKPAPPPPDPALGSGSAVAGYTGPAAHETGYLESYLDRLVDGYGMSIGGTVAALYDGRWTGLVGGEVSGFWLSTGGWVPSWYGGYLEGVRDIGAHTERFSIGPEIGAAMVGADAGALVELSHGSTSTRYGATLRGVITLGWVQLYVRYNHYFDSDPGANGIELGVLLKWPFLQTSTGWGR